MSLRLIPRLAEEMACSRDGGCLKAHDTCYAACGGQSLQHRPLPGREAAFCARRALMD